MGAMSKRVVILGGGFAGVSAAQELTRRLKREHRLSRPDAPVADGVEVLLLNRDNYFVFQPLLADIISGTIETTHVVVPLRRMLPDCQVEVGYVAAIDAVNGTVMLTRRLSGAVTTIDYDALIIAIGSVTDLDLVPGMAEHAVGIRTLGDLVKQTEGQMLQVKNFGKKSLQEIADLLEREGLNFGMRFEESTDGVRILDWGTPPSQAAAAAPDDEE